jgi:hypothetical protein
MRHDTTRTSENKMTFLHLLGMMAALLGTTQNDSGVIAGKVSRLDGSGGIPGVQVLLVGPATGPGLNAILSNPLMAAEIAEGASFPQVTITTGDDGRFSFKDLAPGLYTLRARREGYFGAALSGDSVTSTVVTATVPLVAGEANAEISLTMARGVTISGRIRYPNGQPMVNVGVGAFQLAYNNGKPVLSAANSKMTDDRGEYRLFWLPPGDYYVGVTPPRPSTTDGRPEAYAKTYYPAATDARTAQRLTVIDGVDLQNMDITVRPLGTSTVSGQVINALSGGGATQPSPFSMFYLLPRDPTLLTDTTVPGLLDMRSDRTGRFELRGVPTGSYDLLTTAQDGQGRAFPGRARIEVGPGNLENVVINIRPGVEVKARVRFDGQMISAQPVAQNPVLSQDPNLLRVAPSPSLVDRGSAAPAIRLQLRSKENNAALFDSAAAFNASSDSEGSVVFPNVPESVYTVQVSGSVPANAYVADIREGGVSIYGSGLEITGERPGLIEVILASGGSTVKGVARDAAGKPAINALIVLIPESSRRQNVALYKNVRTGTDGAFTITAVPPGEYKLFAWRSVFSVPATAYMNADFLSKYESRGQPLSIGAGGSPAVELTLIPTN